MWGSFVIMFSVYVFFSLMLEVFEKLMVKLEIR